MEQGNGTEDNKNLVSSSEGRLGYRKLRSQQGTSRFTVDRIVRFLLGAGVVAIIIWLIWYFAALVIYLLVGLVLAYLMQPLVNRVQSFGLGRISSVFVTFLLVFGGIGVVLTFLVPFTARQLTELSQQVAVESGVQVTGVLPGFSRGGEDINPGDFIIKVDGEDIQSSDQLQALLRTKRAGDPVTLVIRDQDGAEKVNVVRLKDREEAAEAQTTAQTPIQGRALETLGLAVRDVMFADLVSSIEERLSSLVPVQEGMITNAITGVFETLFQEDRLTQLMGSIVSFFTDVFYAILVIPFVCFFVLKDGTAMRRAILRLVPNRYFEITLAINEKVEMNIGRYFRGLMLQCISIATLATVLLSIVGLQSAVAVGIFAGLANTIPYFGPLMGFLAGTLVGVAQTGDFSLILGILIAMGLTQIADNALFQPLIFSRAAQAHPLVILFVVLIGAQLGGIVGMLVAIPVITIVRVVVQQILWSLRNYRILQAA
ncbi:MAG TPA: AI-2E family transporter [Rhodothermales bacterium]|nr:AI-2E family transporter [Rhodothermales bacterium]